MSLTKKVKNQMRKAKQQGMSNVDLLRMREIARVEANRMQEAAEKEALEKAFLLMLGIPLNILLHDYWKKSAKKRLPQFIKECISLYEAVEMGVVEFQDVSDLVYDLAGVRYEAEWMKCRKDEQELPRVQFSVVEKHLKNSYPEALEHLRKVLKI